MRFTQQIYVKGKLCVDHCSRCQKYNSKEIFLLKKKKKNFVHKELTFLHYVSYFCSIT